MRTIRQSSPVDTIDWDNVKARLKTNLGVVVAIYDNKVSMLRIVDKYDGRSWDTQTFAFHRGFSVISAQTEGWDAFVAKVSRGGCGQLLYFDDAKELTDYIRANVHLSL